MTREKAMSLLGLKGRPTENEVKQAYRKQARIYHPDNQNGSTEMFLHIGEAYTYLVEHMGGTDSCKLTHSSIFEFKRGD